MEFTQRLMQWYAETARPFPWRRVPPDAYMVLVSETMLQQTQASRVAELLPPFMKTFPSIQQLAAASNADVVLRWKGLGYNSRALRLRDAARAIVENHGGVVPSQPDVLRALPGIGPYTSAAIACFAYNVWTVVLDVNVRRVYSRWLRKQATTSAVESDAELVDLAECVIPRDVPSVWHHAVMDLGATICTARKPKCTACPLSDNCPSAGTMQEAVRTRRPEPLFRGEPRRLWRGRVVELLRGADAAGLTRSKLDRAILGREATDTERQWLDDLVTTLEHDGLLSRKGLRISLAD
jgi:A/G-specific adenine glycosylase